MTPLILTKVILERGIPEFQGKGLSCWAIVAL